MTDLSTAVIGLVILSSFVSLILYLNRKENIKKRAADTYLKQLIAQHNLQIDTTEEQRHLLLALDRQNKKLLYIEQPMGHSKYTLIDLKEMQTSRVADIAQTFFMDDEKKQKDTLTTQIDLELTKYETKEVFAITFYNYIEHSASLLPDLRSRANHWNKLLQEVIRDRKAPVT